MRYLLIGALYDFTYCLLVSLDYLVNLRNLYIFHGFLRIIFYGVDLFITSV
jgi:hypothetical protein